LPDLKVTNLHKKYSGNRGIYEKFLYICGKLEV
jgi:hypothetical protein